jgi:DNA-binding NarL/FixJ family response regulator
LDVLSNGGQALVWAGDAGIGKTQLWHATVNSARERGMTVLTSTSSSAEAQLAFTTIGDLFESVVADVLPELPPLQKEALESALLIREPLGTPLDGRTLGVALVAVMRSLAAEHPVLLAVDDAQWIDASSAHVLSFMLRRLSDAAVGLLATVRGPRLDVLYDLDRSFAGLRQIVVEPLSIGAIHSLIVRRLGTSLPRPILTRVYEASGGNPFFAQELARGIAAGTLDAVGPTVPLPDSLHALVEQRLAALPTSAAVTLVSAAALATPSVSALQPLSSTVVADLEVAERHDVIRFDGDRIRFTHPLLVPACYALLPLHRRRDIHRGLAELDLDIEERARHLALATVGPDAEVASALDEAADRAMRRGAVQAAAELAERATALTPPELASELSRRQVIAADLAVEAGDSAKARRLLEQVVATASPGPLRAEGLSRLADVRALSEGNPASTELLLLALEEPDLAIGQKARILGALAWNAAVGGDSAAATQYAATALNLAEQLGDLEVLVDSLTTSADITFWRYGSICRELLARATVLRERARESMGADPRGADLRSADPRSADPRNVLAHQLGRADHFDEARQLWDGLISECDRRNDPTAADPRFFRSRMEVSAGRWTQALELCSEAVAIAQQTGRGITEPLCEMIASEIAAYRGTVDRALVRDQVETARRMGYGGAVHRLNRALATADLASDNPAAAWAEVASLFEGITDMDEVLAQLAGSVAIEALVGIGRDAEAERLLDLLDARAATADTDLRALADRGRGLVLHARGHHDDAIALLERAAEVRELPAERNPFEQARTLFLLGRVRRESNLKKAARDALEQAAEIFERLGAKQWLERTRAEIRRIGGRNVTTGEFSETERRIVELVVAGRMNREIAAELYLSPNTVAWNLSRVYRKLGVTSRTGLVAHVAGLDAE